MNSPSTFIRRYPIPVILASCAILAVGLWLTRPTQTPAEIVEKARAIDTIHVQTGSLSPSIPVFVTVTTPYHAQLRSSVTADVVRLDALEGTLVNIDDTLVQLDDKEPSLIVEQRRADVLEVRAQIAAEHNSHENELFVLGDLNKLTKLGKRNRQNIIKEHQIRLDRLNALLIRSQASLKLAELDLERTRIRSPFNGRVTKLHVSVGDRVRPGDAIIDVYDHQSMELRGPVATRYIATLQRAISDGIPLAGKLDLDGRLIEARLNRLGGEINNRSGSLDAIFRLDSSLTDIQLGRNVRLDLQLTPVDGAFAVPIDALYGTDTVYRVVDQRLQAVKVKRLGDYPPVNGKARVLLYAADVRDHDVIMVTQLPNAIAGLLVKPNPQ